MGERTEPGTKDCYSVAVTTGLIGLKNKLAQREVLLSLVLRIF